MKLRKAILSFGLCLLALSDGAFASDDHGHDEKPSGSEERAKPASDGHAKTGDGRGDEEASTGGVGPENAVTAADEHDGIKLSPKALQTIGLQAIEFTGAKIPESALVFYQDKVGAYRLRQGWYRLVPVNGSKEGRYFFAGKEFEAGDRLVVAGVALLRVAELDAFSEETGHDH